MLNIEDSIGFEWRKNGSKGRSRIHLFICKSCPNTIKSRICYLKNHSGLCNPCSSKIAIKRVQESNRLRPFEARYNILIQKTKHEPVDITYEDYIEYTKIDKCHYCDKHMNWMPHDNNPGFWLDRKDNTKYHTKDNVVVCCGDCNKTKRDFFTYEEFMLLRPVLCEIRNRRILSQESM